MYFAYLSFLKLFSKFVWLGGLNKWIWGGEKFNNIKSEVPYCSVTKSKLATQEEN